MSDFLKTVQERVVIYDGAMGTSVQARNLPLDDFWGKEGYNDILVLSRPDVVRDIHAAYFDAGADVVETNTFSSTRIVMAEYDMSDQVHEVNLAAAKLAQEVAAELLRPRAASDLSPARWARPPSCPRSATLASTTWLPPIPSKPLASSTAALTFCCSRPARTSCKPRRGWSASSTR